MRIWLTKIISMGLMSSLILSCGKEEDTELADAGDLPQAGSINLSGLGGGSTALSLAERDCDAGSENMGWLMGLGLGAACNSTGFASNILLGSEDGDHDSDGELTCDDWTYAEENDQDAGILTGLICDPNFRTQRLVSYYGVGDGSATGIDFRDASATDDFTAAGSWLAGDEASFPAEIRLFTGTDLSSLTGIFDVQLDSVDKGNMGVRWQGLNVQSQFNNVSDATSCEASPSSETCFTQSLALYAPGTDVFEGFNVQVYADNKLDPTFLIVEGKFSYSATQASAWSVGDSNPCSTEMASTRKLHIRTVQKGTQIWSSAKFYDENDELHSCTVGAIDLFDSISTGYCENLADGASDFGQNPECTDITVADYDSIWGTETSFGYVTSDPTAIFDFTPKTVDGNEICTPDGCSSF